MEGEQRLNIIDEIPVGRAKAITGKALSYKTGIAERHIREMISEARKTTVILNFQDGRGYFRPSDDEMHLVKRWKLQEESRLKRHALALRAARQFVRENNEE